MNETETRPTPEEIAEALEDQHDGITSSPTIDEFTEALAEHGYRIVHPDDYPPMGRDDTLYLDAPYGAGWNDCLVDIFGGDDE